MMKTVYLLFQAILQFLVLECVGNKHSDERLIHKSLRNKKVHLLKFGGFTKSASEAKKKQKKKATHPQLCSVVRLGFLIL